ncbi:Phospholipase C [Komagataella phaffii CBS 7435]|uniref:Phosphoinositide phospholipase C n=2 Tax=Komagataella phaffii TaxID=460519 RepID=C4R8N7_KOMPG|nr:Phospholipase C [Komagataella phaffii GS115]AOA65223.1 GQ67_05081T0 [Komagataella phaffii]CAH2450635.1 Phospholipase C [Komagataella phaffii CBS 7435]AOA69998.1 GQ68_05062T0 [Komagataella phaffii GS115]CAY71962.1 Phospholipase C [Komagataella phaffii GS115]CCA40437.1 Phospholipase C [Komagataella phaffii CBS 7435]
MDLSSRLSSLRNIDSSSDTLPSYSNPNDRNIIKSLLVKGKSLIGKEKHRTFDLPQSNKEHFPSHPIDKKTIPPEFISPGVPLVRVTHKKKVNKSFRIDFDNGLLVWDSKASSSIKISKIKQIRQQHQAWNYIEELQVPRSLTKFWISIIYIPAKKHKHNNIKTLHLIAGSEESYSLVVETLTNMVAFNDTLRKTQDLMMVADYCWNNISSNGVVTLEGISGLINHYDMCTESDYIKSLFDTVNPTDCALTFDQFKTFISLLQERKEVTQLFYYLTSHESNQNQNNITLPTFTIFLRDIQEETMSDKEILTCFTSLAIANAQIPLSEFTKFFLSDYLQPIKNIQSEEDLTRPLNEYFISSSHNTYLLGRQIVGISSVEGYVKALQKGCRCIEIDIWDGSITTNLEEISPPLHDETNDSMRPVVKHGRSFTSAVDLKQVLKTIKKNAFIRSSLPLILSLEIHCNLENQLTVKRLILETFGTALVKEPIMGNESFLPSPLELMHRVLIKVKKTKTVSKSGAANNTSTSLSSSFGTSVSGLSEDETKNSSKLPIKKISKEKIHPELSFLGIYLSGIKFRNFSLPESKSFNHVFSFSESKLKRFMKEETKIIALLKHNKRYLMRAYPARFRYSSTNFNPLPFWEIGVPMVATNWQTFDLGQQLNEALFDQPFNSPLQGYVLKPSNLRNITITSNKKVDLLKNQAYCKLINVNVQVITARQLSLSNFKKQPINPFVEFEIHGCNLSCKDQGKILRTKTVQNNGFNPSWDENFNVSFKTNQNNLNFIRLLVKNDTGSSTYDGNDDNENNNNNNNDSNDNSELISSWCARLAYVKNGYRYLRLVDAQGEESLCATLFVKFDITEERIITD